MKTKYPELQLCDRDFTAEFPDEPGLYLMKTIMGKMHLITVICNYGVLRVKDHVLPDGNYRDVTDIVSSKFCRVDYREWRH